MLTSGEILKSNLRAGLQQNVSKEDDRLDAEVAWDHNLSNENTQEDARRGWRRPMYDHPMTVYSL